MPKTDFFEGIRQTKAKIDLYEVSYPIFCRDLSSLSVFLLAPLDRVRNLLPSLIMHPFRVTPRHCIVTITASEYKDSDLGPYNQVSLGIPFFLDKKSPVFMGSLRKPPEVPMIYLVHLPVTTEISRATGIAMANYPEFPADIRFDRGDEWIHCKVEAQGKNILSLSGRKIDLRYTPRQRVCPVTLRQSRLLRSELNFSECDAGFSKKPSDVRLEFGNHPIGLKLKDLNFGRVLQYQYCPAQQAVLTAVCESYPI